MDTDQFKQNLLKQALQDAIDQLPTDDIDKFIRIDETDNMAYVDIFVAADYNITDIKVYFALMNTAKDN